MIPGLGYLGLIFRRPVTLLLCGVAFWAGTEIQHAALKARCLDAGGTFDVRGICRGVP
ncbi:MAG: hypothetical protein AAGK37_16380 [Pseudomonadota bacterium]